MPKDLPNRPVERSMADIKAELKEEHEWRMRLHEEVAELIKKNENLHAVRASLATGLIQERIDLQSRIIKIDMRVRALGFDPDDCVVLSTIGKKRGKE